MASQYSEMNRALRGSYQMTRILANATAAAVAVLLLVSVSSCENSDPSSVSKETAAGSGAGGAGKPGQAAEGQPGKAKEGKSAEGAARGGKSAEGKTGGKSGGKGGPGGASRAPVPVLAADAVVKSAPIRLLAIGKAEPYSSVSIRAQVGGLLTGVHFAEGKDVKKGDLLFTIDPRPYDAALHKEQANLAKDTVDAKNAEVDNKRYETMAKKDVISKEQADQVRTAAESKAAQLKADQAAVEVTRLQLEYCTIKSPLDGRTGDLMVHEGNVVKPNDIALVDINQITPIYVTFSIPERELPAVKALRNEGKKVKVVAVATGDEGRPEEGELAFLDNAVDSNTGMIKLKAVFPNEDRRLWPGEFVSVTMILGEEDQVVMVPSQAVQPGQQGFYVYVIKPDVTVENRTIKVGRTVDGETVIESGLAAGEKVVTDGHLRLAPGYTVEIKASVGGETASAANGAAAK